MCLILFALGSHPEYPIVLAANRDEFHDRPSAPLGLWTEQPGVLAGRDLQAGGTWLGLSRSGRFAAVTNVRSPTAEASYPRSRGGLCIDWLMDGDSASAFANALDVAAYAPFNLLFGSLRNNIHYLSSRNPQITVLGDACYGLSNDSLDTDWPKVRLGKQALVRAVGEGAELDRLLELLADRQVAEDSTLPDTGVDRDLERMLSAAFIVGPGYGTRSSLALRVSQHGDVEICERQFDAQGAVAGETRKHLRSFFQTE